MNRIGVLVVDDSALMRKHISTMLASAPQIEVKGIAHSGADAIEKVESLAPDVVTLDVDMPGMSGLETIPEILRRRPLPIIMVSSRTLQGAQVTLDALDLGAVDFVAKPASAIPTEIVKVRDELVEKVLAVASSTVRPARSKFIERARARLASATPPRPRGTEDDAELRRMCIVIGISTGGPPALHEVFEKLSPPLPGIVIVQHMPAHFTGPFANRLNDLSEIEVSEACENDEVRPNRALIAPGGMHVQLKKVGASVRVALADTEPVSGHRPSVDVLFKSAVPIFGEKLVGVIMTGMGRDGADGCKAIVAAGGRTYGQDQETSVVYGMNKVAFQEGGVQRQFALQNLPSLLHTVALQAATSPR